MFTAYHTFYWMGLKYNEKLATMQQNTVFTWVDQLIPGPSKYKHWGQAVLSDGGIVPEPNNLAGDEFCGGGNVTQKYGQPVAYGWGDASCSLEFSFMCRWAQLLPVSGSALIAAAAVVERTSDCWQDAPWQVDEDGAYVNQAVTNPCCMDPASMQGGQPDSCANVHHQGHWCDLLPEHHAVHFCRG